MPRKEDITISTAVSELKSGQIILCPIETSYGLCFGLNSKSAIERISKKLNELEYVFYVESDRLFQKVVKDPSDLIWDIIEYSDSPTNLQLEANNIVPNELIKKDGTITIRYTSDPFFKNILRKYNDVIVTVAAKNQIGKVTNLFQEIAPNFKEISDFEVHADSEISKNFKKLKNLKILSNGEVEVHSK